MVALAQLAGITPAGPPVRFELPNGLRVWVQEERSRPVALVQVTYKVGSLHEGPGVTGIAHYVEHMVYRATERIRNEDIYGYIDRIGGRYTGGTWPEMTQYGELVPAWALESALRVTAERMCCALFDSLEFERERSNVVTEAHGFTELDAVSVLRDAVLAAAFELHPYRYTSNTWARDNLALSRDQAYAWYKHFYGPNNAVLVIVGDVSAAEARRLVEKHFAAIPRAPGSGRIDLIEPPQVVEKRLQLTHPGSRRWLEVAYRAPKASDAEYPVLLVVNRVLSARLARALDRRHRAEWWARDTAAQYPHLYRIGFAGDSSLPSGEMLRLLDEEIARLARDLVPEDELARARSAPAADSAPPHVPSSEAGPPRRSPLTALADSLTRREADAWEVGAEVRARIERATAVVSADDVRHYAQQWLRPSQRTIGELQTAPDAAALPDRIDVPPMRTAPAKRQRPEPTPARALEPLTPIVVERDRRVLPNGVVLRAARSRDTAAVSVLVSFATADDSADVAAALPRLAALRPRVHWAGVRRPALTDTAHARVFAALTPPLGVERDTLVVAIAGNRPVGELLEPAAAALSQLPRRDRTPRPWRGTHVAGDLRVPLADARQVSIMAALPGVPRTHPDRRALELLNYIAGVPWYGGRLGWALTKAGLTYSASAATTFGPSSGAVTFSTTADTRNTNAAIQAIREIVAGIGEDGVEEWELREAQGFSLGRHLLYGARERSENRALAWALAESERSGLDQLDLPAFSRAYLGVTLEEINRVARRYYRADRLVVAATGAIPAAPSTDLFPAGTFRALFDPP